MISNFVVLADRRTFEMRSLVHIFRLEQKRSFWNNLNTDYLSYHITFNKCKFYNFPIWISKRVIVVCLLKIRACPARPAITTKHTPKYRPARFTSGCINCDLLTLMFLITALVIRTDSFCADRLPARGATTADLQIRPGECKQPKPWAEIDKMLKVNVI